MPKQRAKRHCTIKQRIYYIYCIYCIYNIYLHAIGQQGQSRTLGQGQDSRLYPLIQSHCYQSRVAATKA